jgi:hypothetical protein
MDNWQHALRKQYYKRDPLANPIGPQPVTGSPEPNGARHSRTTSVAASVDPRASIMSTENVAEPLATPASGNTPAPDTSTPALDTPQPIHEDENGVEEESKDWLDLPMVTKLESMCHLAEWQFHNTTRLRGIMKDDDENANWVSAF